MAAHYEINVYFKNLYETYNYILRHNKELCKIKPDSAI
jgi:hypothetical protein